jgi:Domain of unknown function (DUF4442)
MNSQFLQLINNKIKFNLFLIKNLPSAYFSSVRLVSANEATCIVKVRYKWFSRNPFKSTYFACLAMAAEMSTGILALGNIYKRKPSVSMLVVGLKAEYFKKATDITTFTCNDGATFKAQIEATIATKQPVTVTAISKGYNKANELVATFEITWSFKARE